MFSNIKSIVLMAAISLSSQYSLAENNSDYEAKAEPQHSLYAKCLALTPVGLLALAFKEIYNLWGNLEAARVLEADDDEAPEHQGEQQQKPQKPSKAKPKPVAGIGAVNHGGCMRTLTTRSTANLNDEVIEQAQTTFSLQHDLSIDPEIAEILKQREVTKEASKKKSKAKKSQTSQKTVKPKKTKSTRDRVSACEMSLAVRIGTSQRGKAEVFKVLKPTKVEDNDILDGIVDMADENNVIQSPHGSWFVSSQSATYEIELLSESLPEKSEFIQHTIVNKKRFQSRRVVVYWN